MVSGGRSKGGSWPGQPIAIKVGWYDVGRVSSYDDTLAVLRALAGIAESLPKNRVITTLADMYFELNAQRNSILGYLTPQAAEKWLEVGTCDMCPGTTPRNEEKLPD